MITIIIKKSLIVLFVLSLVACAGVTKPVKVKSPVPDADTACSIDGVKSYKYVDSSVKIEVNCIDDEET